MQQPSPLLKSAPSWNKKSVQAWPCVHTLEGVTVPCIFLIFSFFVMLFHGQFSHKCVEISFIWSSQRHPHRRSLDVSFEPFLARLHFPTTKSIFFQQLQYPFPELGYHRPCGFRVLIVELCLNSSLNVKYVKYLYNAAALMNPRGHALAVFWIISFFLSLKLCSTLFEMFCLIQEQFIWMVTHVDKTDYCHRNFVDCCFPSPYSQQVD